MDEQIKKMLKDEMDDKQNNNNNITIKNNLEEKTNFLHYDENRNQQ